MKLIEEAVEEAEQAGLPELPDGPGSRYVPWVATYRATANAEMYAASRLGTTRVLVAKSTPDLADKIRRFAREF